MGIETGSVCLGIHLFPPSRLHGKVRFVIPVEECLELGGLGTAVLGGKLAGAIAGSRADSGLHSIRQP